MWLETGDRDGDWDDGAGCNVGVDGAMVVDRIDGTIGRLDDLRQAQSGLRRSSLHLQIRREADEQALLQNIPRCAECTGRHWVESCLNGDARKYGFGSRRAEQDGTRCDYQDSVWADLACTGRGRLVKRQRRAEAEPARSKVLVKAASCDRLR